MTAHRDAPTLLRAVGRPVLDPRDAEPDAVARQRQLQRILDRVEMWTHNTQGPNGGAGFLGRPADGRPKPYPGPPDPWHDCTLVPHCGRRNFDEAPGTGALVYRGRPSATDGIDPEVWRESRPWSVCANEAHVRWSLMMHSFLYELDLPYRRLAELAGIGEAATMGHSILANMLTGAAWGSSGARLAVTWELFRLLLEERFTLPGLLAAAGQDGLWVPPRISQPVWCLRGGRVSPDGLRPQDWPAQP